MFKTTKNIYNDNDNFFTDLKYNRLKHTYAKYCVYLYILLVQWCSCFMKTGSDSGLQTFTDQQPSWYELYMFVSWCLSLYASLIHFIQLNIHRYGPSLFAGVDLWWTIGAFQCQLTMRKRNNGILYMYVHHITFITVSNLQYLVRLWRWCN